MVKGSNPQGQLRAIFGKSPYVRKGRQSRNNSGIIETEKSRGLKNSEHIRPQPSKFQTVKKIVKQIIISKIPREALIQTALMGLSGVIANPAPIVFYKVIKGSHLIYKVIGNYNQKEALRKMAQTGLKSGMNWTIQNQTDPLVDDLTLSAKEEGWFKTIASITCSNERIVGTLFRSTLNHGINDKSNLLTDFVVDGVL